MPAKTWTLTDTAHGEHVDTLHLGERELPAAAARCTLSKQTLRGGLSDGVDAITVDNGRFGFVVLPTRGLGIHRGWLRTADGGQTHVGWKSPNSGPVHPKFVPLMEPSGLGWLDGFDELLVRCGLESNGAPDFSDDGRLLFPLHGRIANRPAQKVDVAVADDGELSVTGVVDETRFHFQKLRLTSTIRTKPGEAGFRLVDEVENRSGSPAGLQMLYHTNFGPPLLDAGARFIAPVKAIVPATPRAAEGIKTWDSYAAAEPGYAEQVFLMRLHADRNGRSRSLLRNAHGTLGATMVFDIRQLPCYTVWKNTTAEADGYVTGLEPGTNFPNPRSFEGEQGRVVPLKPGELVRFELELVLHEGDEAVAAAEKAVAALAPGEPQIFDKPQKGWSPAGDQSG